MSKKEKSKNSKKARNTFFAFSAGTALLLTGGLMAACDGNTGATVTNVAFYSGTVAPSIETTEGKVGDFYFDQTTCVLYLRTANGWDPVSSLKGPKGDQGAPGTPGADGRAGIDGQNGKSAYQIAKDAGKVPAGMTEADWIESLYGAPGADGTQILTGTVDPTAAVEANAGDLYINTVSGELFKYTTEWTSTGVIMKGTPGQQGEPGAAGTQITMGTVAPSAAANAGDLYINTADNFKLYRYDGTEWTFVGELKGADGAQGQQGEAGRGIVSVTKTGTAGLIDTYTITYTSGEPTVFYVTNGAAGEAGRGVASFDMNYLPIGIRYVVNYTDSTADKFVMVNENCFKLAAGTDVEQEAEQVAGMDVYTFTYYTGVGDETATVSYVYGGVSFAQQSMEGVIELHRVSTEAEIRAAFTAGGFIQLQADTTAIDVTAADASLTAYGVSILDLNGYDLNFTTTNPDRCAIAAVGPEAYAIVLDSSMAGDGAINNANGCGFIARNGGTVVVINGEVNAGICFSTNNTLGEGNLVVENGVFNSTQDQPVIYMPAQGQIAISGGEFHGGIYARMGSISISGGLFTTSADPDTDNWEIQDMYGFTAPLQLGNPIVLYAGSYDFEDGNNDLNVQITGGTFVNNVAFENGTKAFNAMQVYVAGKVAQDVNINIMGGTFTSAYGNEVEITDLNVDVISATDTGYPGLPGVPYTPAQYYNGGTNSNEVNISSMSTPVVCTVTNNVNFLEVSNEEQLVAALAKENTIKLMSSLSDVQALNFTKDVVLDLNGNSITFASTNTNILYNNEGKTVVVKNGELNYTSSIVSADMASFITNGGNLTFDNVEITMDGIDGSGIEGLSGVANYGAGVLVFDQTTITENFTGTTSNYKPVGIMNMGRSLTFTNSTLNVDSVSTGSVYGIYDYINKGETTAGTRTVTITNSTLNVTSSVINSLSGIFAESYEADANTTTINIGEDTVVNVERTALSGSGKKTYALRAKGNATINGASNATLNITDSTECTQILEGEEENTDSTSGSYGMTGVIND